MLFIPVIVVLYFTMGFSCLGQETLDKFFSNVRELQTVHYDDVQKKRRYQSKDDITVKLGQSSSHFCESEALQNWEVNTLVYFILSGGIIPKDGVDRCSRQVSENWRQLVIISYAVNRGFSDAVSILRFNALDLPDSIGGIVALNQERFLPPRDIDSRLLKLDQARLLSPGSIVEEAALRRAVEITITSDQPELLSRLLRRYRQHYEHSPFRDRIEHIMQSSLPEKIRSNDPNSRKVALVILSFTPASVARQTLFSIIEDVVSRGINSHWSLLGEQLILASQIETDLHIGNFLIALGRIFGPDKVDPYSVFSLVDRKSLPTEFRGIYDAVSVMLTRSSQISSNEKRGVQRPLGEQNDIDLNIRKIEEMLRQIYPTRK